MKRILITPGEPAGIGPDILIKAIQQSWSCELVAIADPELLETRAATLQLPFAYALTDLKEVVSPNPPGSIKIYPVSLKATNTAGTLNVKNAAYVLETLEVAAKYSLSHKESSALVTGPVHKAIMNEAGIPFTGHTEWLAQMAEVAHTVMLFVVEKLKVALATTHLPLHAVPAAITRDSLLATLTVLQSALSTAFKLTSPRIGVTGLNPHAGENGYLGREEIDIIAPVIHGLKHHGWQITGPLPADTIFTQSMLPQFDAILAMYHDQALPLIKYMGFEQAVNVTLGLPFIRTSVDHGTALTIAGTNQANAGSLIKAIALAEQLR